MGILGWICTTVMFVALCVTAQSMFDSYIYFKSENFEKEDEEKED